MANGPLFGQIIEDAEPALQSIMSAGDTALAEQRNILFRATLRESSAARGGLLRAEQTINSRIDDLVSREGFFTKDGKRLTARGRQSLESLANRELTEAFRNFRLDTQHNMNRVINRAVRIQSNNAISHGLPPLSKQQLRAIKKSAIEYMSQNFPENSGLSFYDRLDTQEQFRANQLQRILSRSYETGNAAQVIKRDIRSALSSNSPGTSIQGGTAYKQLRRLLIAEETRVANAVELATIKEFGIRFVYWRLSPAHRWYGGKDICEVHASRVSVDTMTSIEAAGVDPVGLELEGLYRVGSVPAYPHPFCKCFLEPFIVSGSVRR